MSNSEKITEVELLNLLQSLTSNSGFLRLPGALRLKVISFERRRADHLSRVRSEDALVEIGWNDNESWRFVVEAKSRNTPEAIVTAMVQAKEYAIMGSELHPMILVPYLSGERLDELEASGVSGIDACGNAVVTIPGKLYVRRDGMPNRYRGGRDLNNPFRGLSAMVGRMLLIHPRWSSLNELHQAVTDAGTSLSLSQVSKALKALGEERIVTKSPGKIVLTDPLLLLDQLAREWKPPVNASSHACNLMPGARLDEILGPLSYPMPDGSNLFQWAETGESSVGKYISFSQAGPRRIAVTNLPNALQKLHPYISNPAARNLADVIFIQTRESGYYFNNIVDDEGHRWADPLQTWLELQAGDARQKAAGDDVRNLILRKLP